MTKLFGRIGFKWPTVFTHQITVVMHRTTTFTFTHKEHQPE